MSLQITMYGIKTTLLNISKIADKQIIVYIINNRCSTKRESRSMHSLALQYLPYFISLVWGKLYVWRVLTNFHHIFGILQTLKLALYKWIKVLWILWAKLRIKSHLRGIPKTLQSLYLRGHRVFNLEAWVFHSFQIS